MHADQRAQLAGALHQLVDGAIVHHQHIGIRHEDLEAGDALGDHRVHVVEPCVVRAEVGDGHVQAVVDAGFALGLGAPGLERLGHWMSHGLQRKVDDHGGAADGRCARAPLVVVRADGAAEGHVEVGVDVDAAGEDEHAGCVDHGVSGCVDLRGYARNRLALDQYIGEA